MNRKRKWKFDEDDFNIGDDVFIRNDLDANKKTKKMPLLDHAYSKSVKIIDKKNSQLSFNSIAKKPERKKPERKKPKRKKPESN